MSAKRKYVWARCHWQRNSTLKLLLILGIAFASLGFLHTEAEGASFQVPFNANSIWNKPIGTSPAIHPNSAGMIQLLASTTNGVINIDGINGAWSVAVYEADASAPVKTVCDDGRYRPCEKVPIPVGMYPSPDADGKTVIIDRSKTPNRAWSFWSMKKSDGSNGDWTADYGAFGWGDISTGGDGIRNYGGGEWGGRVTGWNYYAGLITPEEIAQGHIDHALEFNIPHGITARKHIWPALGDNGVSWDPNAIPMGTRLQLDPSIDVEKLPLSRGGKIIARALQVYGAWVGDSGSMAALDAREYVKLDKWGYPTIDSSPWKGLLTYRDLYKGFPIDKMRVVLANPSEFYQETGGDKNKDSGNDNTDDAANNAANNQTTDSTSGNANSTTDQAAPPVAAPPVAAPAEVTAVPTQAGPLICVNTSGTIPANAQFNSIGTFNLLKGEVVTLSATHSQSNRTTAVYISGFGYAWGSGSASWKVTVPADGTYTFTAGGGNPGKIFFELQATTTGPNC